MMCLEIFSPNAYIAECDIADVHFTSSTSVEYLQTGNKTLYWDHLPQNKKYDEGERIGANTASSGKTVRVSISANEELNYMGLNYAQTSLVVRNLMVQSYAFYSAIDTNNNYTTSPATVAALMDTNGVTHYFNSNNTTITRLSNAS